MTSAVRGFRLALLVFMVCCGSACKEPQRASTPRHFLLVTLDTVRADRLGAYGKGDAGTPWMDALAARGTRFERAYTPVPLTLPAHLSILTGRYPPAFGVHVNGTLTASPSVPTAAEILSQAGFFTAAAIGGYPLSGGSPTRRGFAVYDDRLRVGASGEALERSAEEVVDAALQALRDRGDRRAFLWVHLFDPHDPYEPPEAVGERFQADPYQGEIAYVDRMLERLAAGLQGVLGGEEVLTVLVADHGESLGEHGEETHGYFLYDSTVRVPWIVAGPGVPVTTVAAPVSVVDLLPTVLHLLGILHPGPFDGRALLPSSPSTGTGPRLYLETLLPETHYGFAPLRGAVEGTLKYIAAPRPEIYELRIDPGETHNVAAERPEDLQALAAWVSRTAGPGTEAAAAPADPRLAGLGYVGTGSAPGSARLDPKDGLPVYRDLQAAARSLEGGRPLDALPLLDRLLARSDTPSVRLKRAQALRMSGRLAEADRELAHALAAGPLPGAELEAARIAAALGDWPRTIAASERHLQEDPGSVAARLFRGAGLEMTGRVAEAETEYRACLAVDPFFRDGSLRLAALLVRAGRLPEARAQLADHLARHPDDQLARGLLGAL